MPFYEYDCDCGYKGELRLSMEDRHKARCPNCGSVLRRRFSIPNIRIAIPFIWRSPTGEVIDKIPDKARSTDRNLETPPDHPNLLEV